jgi:acyl-coenzyme A thioesterase PaaI-like protein
MSEAHTNPRVEPVDPQALALARRLRDVITALTSNEIAPDSLARANEIADALLEGVAGPRALRWYEEGGTTRDLSPRARTAYFEQSPIRGHLNPVAPPLEVVRGTRDDGTDVMIGRTNLGLAYEGPPHGVHGGWVAALFDEMLGVVQEMDDTQGVTAVLTVKYRKVTPVEEELRFESWVHERRGRRLVARATCHAGDTLTAEAEGVFIHVDFEEVTARMRERRDG